MPSFWPVVNRVIRDADVILLLLDARMVEQTRNVEVEDKVREAGKPLIYVIAKSDLITQESAEAWKRRLQPCVFVSAQKHQGTTMLKERIFIVAQRSGVKEEVKIGVLGYPNVGKSSLINALKGRKSAPTSSVSGFTKGVQKVRASRRLLFLDTPGVIPYRERDDKKHAMIGTADVSKVKNPEVAVMELMEQFPGMIEAHFNVDERDDKEETLLEIARSKHIIKKGGIPDTKRMARTILQQWQKGAL